MKQTIHHQPAKEFCAGSSRAGGRVHLPAAPRAFARVRYTPERTLPRALSPNQAMNWLEYLAEQGEEIKVVNINGPGDPLATPELTLQTLYMVREKFPKVSMCLTTLGFGAKRISEELAGLGLAHVSILMDAVTPDVAGNVYAWVRPGAKTLPLAEACEVLLAEQAAAIRGLVEAGMEVQVKTTVYPGVNSEHVVEIAKAAAGLGAGELKIFPFLSTGEDCVCPSQGADPGQMTLLASQAAQHLPSRFVDLPVCKKAIEFDFKGEAAAQATLAKPTKQRPNLAVCSSDGFDVDLHLGQAGHYLIYGPQHGPVCLLESRPAPGQGGGESRWQETALILSDCFAVLAAAAGEAPKRVLAEQGLTVLDQEGNIEGLVDVLYGGGKKKGRKN